MKRILFLSVVVSLVLAHSSYAGTITVSDTCTLVSAIESANADTSSGGCAAGSGEDTIELAANSNLIFKASYNNTPYALPLINSKITINGNNSTLTRDVGSPDFGFINSSGDLTLKNLKFQNANGTKNGGAINSTGNLQVYQSIFINNKSKGDGGSIYQTGSSITIESCTFQGADDQTVSAKEGGAIYVSNPASISISKSAFINNLASKNGGALYLSSGLSLPYNIINNTFYNNTADNGGAIFIAGKIIFDPKWGKSSNYNLFFLYGNTITKNTAKKDGGGFDCADPGYGPEMGNNILDANTAGANGPNCLATISSAGNNIVSDQSGCSGLLATDKITQALFAKFIDGEIPSEKYFILSNASPAINACSGSYDNVYTKNHDQLGRARVGVCDIGSVEAICGDTVIHAINGEECDDGVLNGDAPDKCRLNCKNPSCGDGIADSFEQCGEPGLPTAEELNIKHQECVNCAISQLAYCGDSVKNQQEQCDGQDGVGKFQACNDKCELVDVPGCGNYNLDPGEQCEYNDPDCSNSCTLMVCGNKIIDVGKNEVCDDGNTVGGDGCSADCKKIEECGDGLPDVGEECDNGAANSDVLDGACRKNCKKAFCGDKIFDKSIGEECENGVTILIDPVHQTCEQCKVKTQLYCGDGIVSKPNAFGVSEQCDLATGIAPNQKCSGDCLSIIDVPLCGNQKLDAGEDCDKAISTNCRDNCTEMKCGDKIIDPAEACDDGNAVGGDGCSADCKKIEKCGDKVLDTGESCDDGNILDNDGCDHLCKSESPTPIPPTTEQKAVCGNKIVDLGEECDDGNLTSGDGCSSACIKDVTSEGATTSPLTAPAPAESSGGGKGGCSLIR